VIVAATYTTPVQTNNPLGAVRDHRLLGRRSADRARFDAGPGVCPHGARRRVRAARDRGPGARAVRRRRVRGRAEDLAARRPGRAGGPGGRPPGQAGAVPRADVHLGRLPPADGAAPEARCQAHRRAGRDRSSGHRADGAGG
jgi:hypothetical protein